MFFSIFTFTFDVASRKNKLCLKKKMFSYKFLFQLHIHIMKLKRTNAKMGKNENGEANYQSQSIIGANNQFETEASITRPESTLTWRKFVTT